MGRIAIFIDGGYIKKILESFDRPRIDYELLSKEISEDGDLLRTYYYDCPPYVSSRPTEEEKKRQSNFDRFYRSLEALPRYQTRLGRLARYQTVDGPKFVQKKVDVLLAVDLVRLACEHQIQKAALIAGDSDFVPAIEIAKDAGTVVALYYYSNPKPHDELLRVCDERNLISRSFIDKIRIP